MSVVSVMGRLILTSSIGLLCIVASAAAGEECTEWSHPGDASVSSCEDATDYCRASREGSDHGRCEKRMRVNAPCAPQALVVGGDSDHSCLSVFCFEGVCAKNPFGIHGDDDTIQEAAFAKTVMILSITLPVAVIAAVLVAAVTVCARRSGRSQPPAAAHGENTELELAAVGEEKKVNAVV